MPSPSFALDGVDGESIWLASDPQYRAQAVERIAGGHQLSLVTHEVPISGNVASGKDIAAVVPFYNTVTVWSAQLKSHVFNVPTNDNIGTLRDFDQLNVDPEGTISLYRQHDGENAAPVLYLLRKRDVQFVQVTLSAKSWAGPDCKSEMRIHGPNADYEIISSTLELRKVSPTPCAWSSDPRGIRHAHPNGTQKYLQLSAEPQGSVPLPLAFNISPNGNAWVWTGQTLCEVESDERVFCAPVHIEERDSTTVELAKDGSIWFKSAFQTLVHARFVHGS